MAELSPLAAYMAANDQRIAQLQQPRSSDIDPMALFALAQGFLSPTRTGGFAESLGNAAGQAIGPLSRAKQSDQDRLDKIDKLRETQVRLALEQQRINDLKARALSGADRDPSLVFKSDIDALQTRLSNIDLKDLNVDENTPEGKAIMAERRQKAADVQSKMDALIARRFGGAGAGAAPAPGGAPAASPPPPASASVNAAKKGQAGLVPTEEELKNARVVDGVKYIKRGNQVYRVDE